MYAGTDRPRRRPAVFLATFGYAWLMIGLFTGTIVLVVFVRGIIKALHEAGFGAAVENRVLMAVMAAFVVASFLLTRAVVRRLYRTHSLRARRIALGALVLPGLLSMWAWSNPTLLLARIAGSDSSSVSMRGGPTFIFGPYPDGERMAELRKEGVKSIISLQHPSVLVEVQGIHSEEENAKRLGMQLIHAPMLPWVSDNRASLEKIREIARSGHGVYYVHCGLGRDRVNVVKRVIESMSESTEVRLAAARDLQDAKGLEQRTAPFEHGRLFELKPGVWLVPIPNRMELSEILFGARAKVLLVLDSADRAQRAWLTEATAELQSYVVPFAVVPFTERDAGDAARVAQLMSRIDKERGRVTVVVPRTPFGVHPGERSSRIAQVLLRRYRVNLAASPADRRSSALSGDNSGR